MRLRMFSTLLLLMDITETARRPIVAEQGEEARRGDKATGGLGERLSLAQSPSRPVAQSRLQLYFDIALATPIVKRSSTASAACATIWASASRSFFGNSER